MDPTQPGAKYDYPNGYMVYSTSGVRQNVSPVTGSTQASKDPTAFHYPIEPAR